MNKRIGRLRFVLYSVLLGIIAVVNELVLDSLPGNTSLIIAKPGQDFNNAVIVIIIINIALIIASFIIMIKRLHDIDYSGWLSLLILVPGINIAFIFFLLFAKGTPGPNRFSNLPI